MAKKKESPPSGMRRVTIRMPSDLHAALLQRRQETGESLNDMLIEAAARLLELPIPAMQKGIPGRKPGRRAGRTGQSQ